MAVRGVRLWVGEAEAQQMEPSSEWWRGDW